MHLHKCDHINCFTGRVVRLTAKPRYLLLLHRSNKKYNTITALPGAFGLMYIAETLINPLYSDVAFCRDSEGDESGHYEFWGGVMTSQPVVTFHKTIGQWLAAGSPRAKTGSPAIISGPHRSKIISKVAGSEINLS